MSIASKAIIWGELNNFASSSRQFKALPLFIPYRVAEGMNSIGFQTDGRKK
jgi:hypothetical protein